MTRENIFLDNGELIICRYCKDDKDYIIKSLINDIYKNSNYDNTIRFINKVIPNKDNTIQDVLDKYTKTDSVFSHGLLFTRAGILTNDAPCSGNIDDEIDRIKEEAKYLYNSGFYNIIFSKRMRRDYGNPDLFIFYNDDAKEFIDTNSVGETKIIDRILKSTLTE